MVDTKSGFDKLIQKKGLVYIMILPFLEPVELLRFAMLNKKCMSMLDPVQPNCVNYKLLYET